MLCFVDQTRSELKIGGGAHRSRKWGIKSLTEATNVLIYRMSALNLVKLCRCDQIDEKKMYLYLLLTEFEVRTVSKETRFFPFDLWPKHEARGP